LVNNILGFFDTAEEPYFLVIIFMVSVIKMIRFNISNPNYTKKYYPLLWVGFIVVYCLKMAQLYFSGTIIVTRLIIIMMKINKLKK